MSETKSKSNQSERLTIAEARMSYSVQTLKQRYRSKRLGKPIRTTFTLQEKTIKSLAEMSTVFGLSPRDVFIECYESLSFGTLEAIKDLDEGSRTQEKQRKTYVIDDYSLNKFKRLAKELNISRDYCIELLIDIAHNAFKSAYEEDAEIISQAKVKVDKALKIISSADSDCAEKLGDGHFVTEALMDVYISIESISKSMKGFLESGIWEDMS